ncbi:hypothetical protein FOI68_05165 [Brevibacillus sp. LEMMJ03]|uniref:hypothetical protein n=1 Tax=Brevibacillus sp. LEMMJ03 TaxID=2595056 RepID=UPI001180156C|nr:hypothetical protein [Brevibacillus sp. LEMMJ03]TRY26966.1 hypothetical protein FOI68_05165 [Brevibacillus sp. LEMMJ03]
MGAQLNVTLYTRKGIDDLDRYPELDADHVSERNRRFYERLSREIGSLVEHKDFVMGGVGVETTITYADNVKEMMENSYNVFRWFLPFSFGEQLIGYREEKTSNLFVLDKVE